MNARNGKIARLPRDLREELNERLERSVPSPQLLDWLNGPREVKKEVFWGGELGRKPAKYIIQVENDAPGAKLELTGDEKVEKPEPEPGQGESKSVKPARKRRTVQRAGKTKPGKLANPLKANDIEDGKKAQSSPD